MNLVAIQLNSGVQWELNRQQIVEQLATVPDERPCLVVLRENFACLGATADYQAVAETLGDGPIQRQLAAWARENEIWLVAGSLPTRVTGETRLHTSSLVYGPDGSLQGHYHKLHLFDVDEDLYGRLVRVEFLHKLRDEAHFDSIEALTAQIDRDAQAARGWFREGRAGDRPD